MFLASTMPCFPGVPSKHVRITDQALTSHCFLFFPIALVESQEDPFQEAKICRHTLACGERSSSLENHRVNVTCKVYPCFLQYNSAKATSTLMKCMHGICKGLDTLLCFSSCHIKIKPEKAVSSDSVFHHFFLSAHWLCTKIP